MTETEDKKEVKEEKKAGNNEEALNKWLSDKYNIYLLGVLAVTFIIRLYYFIITKDQAHWWDTLAYAALAKESIYHMWTGTNFIVSESIIRAPLLPFIWSILMRLHFSEYMVIILLEFIPSIICVYLIYLIGTKLYNKKIGLISALISSFLWIILFYSARIMTDIPALILCLGSIYFFLKSYEKNLDLKYFSISIILLSLGVLMRNVSVLVGGTYIVFLLITEQHRFLKNKNFWIGGMIGIIPILGFFVYNFITLGNFFPAISSYAESAAAKPEFAWYIIYQFFPHLLGTVFSPNASGSYLVLGNILLLFFIIGLVLVFIDLFLGYDLIRKSNKIKAHIFSLTLMILSLIFFIFIIKAAEDRYLLIFITSILFFLSCGILFVYDKIKKNNKTIAMVVIVVILILGAYSQFHYGHPIIESRISSYQNLKQAFVWVNENTPENAVILGDGIDPYVIYYGNRKFEHWNMTDIQGTLAKSDYLVIASWEHQSQEAIDLINGNISSQLEIQKVFYFDQQQTTPSAAVYKIKK